jgi:peptide/nickel transport system permease protein
MAVNNRALALEGVLARRPRGRLTEWARMARKFFVAKPLGAFGALVMLLLVFAALFAGPITVPNPSGPPGAALVRFPGIAPYPPDELAGATLDPPGSQFALGTDALGRDVLSRVLYGAQVSLKIGIVSVALSTLVGAFLGVITAYWGGWLDLLVQRLVEILQAFPLLVLVLALVAVFGTSELWVILSLSIGLTPSNVRIIRSAALAVKHNPYVEAARCIGAGDLRIVIRHILPNVVAPIIIIASILLGAAILTEASISFLGLGPPPPTPSWGAMLAERKYATLAPWTVIAPGVAVSIAVLGFNLFGDALRDALDPRMRGT